MGTFVYIYIITFHSHLMKLLGLDKLNKMAKKNRGNFILTKAIKSFITEIRNGVWTSQKDLEKSKVKFDCVHSNGFYIADIDKPNRSMVALTFIETTEIKKADNSDKTDNEKEKIKKDLGLVHVLWAGSHDQYLRKFNNKDSITRWLRDKGKIP